MREVQREQPKRQELKNPAGNKVEVRQHRNPRTMAEDVIADVEKGSANAVVAQVIKDELQIHLIGANGEQPFCEFVHVLARSRQEQPNV